jgi:hypothetical protein
MEKLKPGDKVKVIRGRDDIEEKDGGLGVIGVVKEVFCDEDGDTGSIEVTSDLFVGCFEKAWFFAPEELEYLGSDMVYSGSSVCPRCGEVLVEKESCGFFGNKFKVLKCVKCNWC